MHAVQRLVSRVASTPFTVLVQGETGTGKELIARQVHAQSVRRAGPFVAVNCAAIVDSLLEAELFGIEDRTATGVRGRRGKFEEAHGGTLFLDEVVDLSGAAQAKLLRALQDFAIERVGSHQTRTLDVRVIAATNQSLEDLVTTRRFRADLFHRLAGFEIALPPLRDRGTDVLELAGHFLRKHAAGRRMSLSPPAADCLLTYTWPGNVRELERFIQRALVLTDADVLEPEDFPRAVAEPFLERLQPSVDAYDTLRLWTVRFVRLIVCRSSSKTEAARRLGISMPTLRAYLTPPVDARPTRRRSCAA
jgi:transcriptional regulator with PAS, ATPase and Fis domain